MHPYKHTERNQFLQDLKGKIKYILLILMKTHKAHCKQTHVEEKYKRIHVAQCFSDSIQSPYLIHTFCSTEFSIENNCCRSTSLEYNSVFVFRLLFHIISTFICMKMDIYYSLSSAIYYRQIKYAIVALNSLWDITLPLFCEARTFLLAFYSLLFTFFCSFLPSSVRFSSYILF